MGQRLNFSSKVNLTWGSRSESES